MDGNLALAGQVCPEGEALYGFDLDGNILCSPTVVPPDPDPPVDCANLAPYANLSGCEFAGCVWDGSVDLSYANLSGANLTGCTIEAYMPHADLTGANLTYAQVSAGLYRATLVDANLTNANLSSASLFEADFTHPTPGFEGGDVIALPEPGFGLQLGSAVLCLAWLGRRRFRS